MGSSRSVMYSSTVSAHHQDAAYTRAFPPAASLLRKTWRCTTSPSNMSTALGRPPRSSGLPMLRISTQSTCTSGRSVRSWRWRVTEPSLRSMTFHGGEMRAGMVPFCMATLTAASHRGSTGVQFSLSQLPLMSGSVAGALRPPVVDRCGLPSATALAVHLRGPEARPRPVRGLGVARGSPRDLDEDPTGSPGLLPAPLPAWPRAPTVAEGAPARPAGAWMRTAPARPPRAEGMAAVRKAIGAGADG
mmetsp:Transcript_20487/g.65063  ORF Transcript_20487/g.65063 Transcript_20487/m.65063 type:complete len:246 (-) Transcript_20487:180-917(-)